MENKTHRDDAMNERCNICERIIRLCICPDEPSDVCTCAHPDCGAC